MNTDVERAIIRMADSLEDINQKLDHIIRKQTQDFLSGGEEI